MAIADYLKKLVELKNQLVANLKSMGVSADENEKLNTLVPKVLECKTEQNVEFVEGTDFKGTDSEIGISKAISKIIIPEGTTAIGYRAFHNCEGLVSVEIPDGVTSIGKNAFQRCKQLESIIIPVSVKSIGDYAFSNDTSLKDIYYTGTEAEWNAITKVGNWNYSMGSNVSGGTTIHYNYVPE